MGYLSRQPTANESQTKSHNPYAPADEFASLVSGVAIHCCGCKQATSKQHVVIQKPHVFCPNCISDRICRYEDGNPHHENVQAFTENLTPRPHYGGTSAGDGEAD